MNTAPLRVGMIGAGWIAQTHLRSFADLAGVAVAAVADVEPSRAQALAETAAAEAYDSWEQLLDEHAERLDAIVICTPPEHHRAPAIAALESGLPVYLEKPIARTSADATEIVAAADRTGVLCAIGYQWHSLAAIDHIRAELDGQRLGLLVGRSIGPTAVRPWVLRRAEGGGQILERASHHIDLQRAIAGEVSTVLARGGSAQLSQHGGHGGDIEDVISLELAFHTGAVGAIHVAWLRDGIPGIYDMTIAASEALITLSLDPAFALRGFSRDQNVQHHEDRPPAMTAMAHFLHGVRTQTKGPQLCDPTDAAATLAVALACERSLVSGQPVAID